MRVIPDRNFMEFVAQQNALAAYDQAPSARALQLQMRALYDRPRITRQVRQAYGDYQETWGDRVPDEMDVHVQPKKLEKTWYLHVPEVAFFLEKIPAARIVVKEHGKDIVTFFRAAKEGGMSLREQCDAIEFPWVLRNEEPENVNWDVIFMARMLDPIKFGSIRKSVGSLRRVASISTFLRARPSSSVFGEAIEEWIFRNCESLPKGELQDLRDFFLSDAGKKVKGGTKLETVRRWSAEWHESLHKVKLGKEAEAMVSAHGTVVISEDLQPFREFQFRGCDFRLLETAEDFIKEGQEMKHCIRLRYPRATNADSWGRKSVIYSVSRDGKRLATVEFSGTVTRKWKTEPMEIGPKDDLKLMDVSKDVVRGLSNIQLVEAKMKMNAVPTTADQHVFKEAAEFLNRGLSSYSVSTKAEKPEEEREKGIIDWLINGRSKRIVEP